MGKMCGTLYGEKAAKERISSVAGGSRARRGGPRRSIEVQDAGDELANRDPQMSPESPLQAGVILRPAEEVAHQLPEHRTASHELHHARGDRTAQERATIEPPHDACRELQFGAESSLHPSRVLLRAAFGKGASEQFAGANRIKKSFTR